MFGLSGPSVAVDTACSSSLVAVGQAHNALMLGVVPSCLAGGVNLLLSPQTHAMYAVAGGARLCFHYRWTKLMFQFVLQSIMLDGLSSLRFCLGSVG